MSNDLAVIQKSAGYAVVKEFRSLTPQARFDLTGLPLVGILYKGTERSANKPGEELPYFRFKPLADAGKKFWQVYGKKPTLLRAVLPASTPWANAKSFYQWRKAGGLLGQSDGEVLTFWRDKQMEAHGVFRGEAPIPLEGSGYDLKDARRVIELHLILTELTRATGTPAHVMIRTTAKNDSAIYTSLVSYWRTALAMGQDRGLYLMPVVLERAETEITTRYNGKLSKKKHWLLRLSMTGEAWKKMMSLPDTEPAYDGVLDNPPTPNALAVDGEVVDEGGGDLAAIDFGEVPEEAYNEPAGELPPVPEETPPSVFEALRRRTPKGTPYGQLTREQLEVVIERGDPESKAAARVVLDYKFGGSKDA